MNNIRYQSDQDFDPATREGVENIIEQIHLDRCILFLGPDISITNDAQESLTDRFSQALKNELRVLLPSTDIQEGLDDENLNLSDLAEAYIAKRHRSLFEIKVKKFYKSFNLDTTGVSHHAITKLPFSKIINTTPDDLLQVAFEGRASFDYFNYKSKVRSSRDTYIGIPGRPLVYNIFGIAKQPSSVVITTDDRVQFLKTIINKAPSLPPNLSAALKNPDQTFLFIGFDFNEWYLKFLFRILEIPEAALVFALQRISSPLKTCNSLYYSKRFYSNEILSIPCGRFLQLLAKRYLKEFGHLASNTSQPNPPIPFSSSPVHRNILIVNAANDADIKVRNRLISHIRSLRSAIQINHEGTIAVGSNLQNTWEQYFQVADIVIILLSTDLIEDDSLWGFATNCVKQYSSKIFPLLSKPCAWESTNLFNHLKIAPEHKGQLIPFNVMKEEIREEIYSQIINQLEQKLSRL